MITEYTGKEIREALKKIDFNRTGAKQTFMLNLSRIVEEIRKSKAEELKKVKEEIKQLEGKKYRLENN